MKPSLDGKRTNVILPEVMRRRLYSLSKETGISFSDHIRRAVAGYLAQNPSQRPRAPT